MNKRRIMPMISGAALTACCLWHFLPPSPEHIESLYSRGLYRIVVAGAAGISGALPFSLILFCCTLTLPGFAALWIGLWIYRRRRLGHPHWRGLLWGPKWMLFMLPLFWLWFLCFWGIGYQRMPIEARLGLEQGETTDAELKHIADELLELLLRDQPRSEADRDAARAVASISRAMMEVVEEWDGTPIRLPKRVKATPPGLFLMNGTAGMCVPFTLEAHVDGALPDASFVAVAVHELGHIAGVCDEGETNLIGYAAGLRAADPFARYAVALSLYRSIAAQLGGETGRTVMERLPKQAHDDLRRARDVQQQYHIDWLQKWSWRAYNHYLKSQGVKEGVKSYGRGAQLLADLWRAGRIALPKAELPADAPPPEDSLAADSAA